MLEFKQDISLQKENSGCYQAKNGDRLLGSCTYEIRQEQEQAVCYLTALQWLEDSLIGEGLIRSVLHYCGNRGIYIAKAAQDFNGILLQLGFSKTDAGFYGEIPDVLMGNCEK